MSKKYHLCIDIKGVLTSWKDSDIDGILTDSDGRSMTVQEIKAALLDELSEGREMMPYGECDNFDDKAGCMGHDV